MISYTHNTGLMLASVIVSLVAAFTGLALTNNIRHLPESKRKALIVMSAFVLGGGIWSMHFLAMLSIRFVNPINYDLLQTLGSALVAILVMGLALLLLHFSTRNARTLLTAGLLLGGGIVAMHFIGMTGMRGIVPDFHGGAVVASVVVAALMGVIAIRMAYGARSRENIVRGSAVFGSSVVLVHYTAMLGIRYSVDPDYQVAAGSMNPATLAIAVTVTAFVICGSFLLAASTFLTKNESTTSVPDSKAIEPTLAASAADSTASVQNSNAVDSGEQAASVIKLQESSDRGHSSEDQSLDADTLHRIGDDLNVRIPFERNKEILFVSSEEVGAIRADGRYTHVYTRNGVRFCPWSITEAEKRLSGTSFERSHRSYLVNVAKVHAFERNKDTGVCRFTDFPTLTSVPVSRTRVATLAKALGI